MRVILQAAMEEEIAPLRSHFGAAEKLWEHGVASAWEASTNRHQLLLVRSGIGLANGAIAATVAAAKWSADLALAVGTCGGLGSGMIAGDTVIASAFRYAQADATIFGYELGQVPAMPASYPGAAIVSAAAARLGPLHSGTEAATAGRAPQLVYGEVLSGDSFIHRDSVAGVRAAFPAAVAVDMESTATAQAYRASGVAFGSIRTVSDMCDWTEEQARSQDSEFLSLVTGAKTRREHVYQMAAAKVVELLEQL